MNLRAGTVLTALLVGAWAGNATAETVVVDGDTIKLNGTTYRLWGIDAAETKQACADGYKAGEEATAYLKDLLKSDAPVACSPKTTDRYGRTVAICVARGNDLGFVPNHGFVIHYSRE